MLSSVLRSAAASASGAAPVRVRLAASLAAKASVSAPTRALATSASSAASPAASPDPPSENDKFLTSTNAYYVEEMHRQWLADPASVHASWNAYFSGLKRGLRSQDAVALPPVLDDVSLVQAPLTSAQAQGVDDQLKVGAASVLLPLLSPLCSAGC